MKELLNITEKSLSKKSVDEIVKEGVQRILQQALEIEIEGFIEKYSSLKTEAGNRRIVRNGYQNERTFQTKAGNVKIRDPVRLAPSARALPVAIAAADRPCCQVPDV